MDSDPFHMMLATDNQILTPKHPPVGRLSVRKAFDPLSLTQKLYAHHAARYGKTLFADNGRGDMGPSWLEVR